MDFFCIHIAHFSEIIDSFDPCHDDLSTIIMHDPWTWLYVALSVCKQSDNNASHVVTLTLCALSYFGPLFTNKYSLFKIKVNYRRLVCLQYRNMLTCPIKCFSTLNNRKTFRLLTWYSNTRIRENGILVCVLCCDFKTVYFDKNIYFYINVCVRARVYVCVTSVPVNHSYVVLRGAF